MKFKIVDEKVIKVIEIEIDKDLRLASIDEEIAKLQEEKDALEKLK